jgi:hypothetical protein
MSGQCLAEVPNPAASTAQGADQKHRWHQFMVVSSGYSQRAHFSVGIRRKDRPMAYPT